MKLNAFQKCALITVVATIMLIFVGGLVRASGAGLGCPDWPKCFGRWIPPLSVRDLPPGFDPAEFNALKTWTEYLNRLFGVLVGLLITATFFQSFRYLKSRPAVFAASFVALVLVAFQGWLGGQVVRSGLSEGIITAHMILAMILLITLLYAAHEAIVDRYHQRLSPSTRRSLFWIGASLLGVTLIQVGLGTQVREAVDSVGKAFDLPRGRWLEQVGSIDEIHRTTSWLVLIGVGGLLWAVRSRTSSFEFRRLAHIMVLLVLCQVAFGVGLAYWGMPPVFQVLHLGFSSLLICAQFIFLLKLRDDSRSADTDLTLSGLNPERGEDRV
jgi:heme a synthase